jgi:signal transduction histidine kinase/tetratricopeptide (TPR) repeat protein
MRIPIFILFFCFLQIAYSQTPKVDSLKALLPGVKDEQRIEVLQALVINLWLNYPDSASRYAREAIAIAKDLKSVRMEAISVRLLGGVQLYQGTYDSALHYSKLAYALSVSSKDSTLISSGLNNIGFAYYHLGSYSEALENLLRSLNMKYEIKQNYGLGQTLNNVGLVYSKLKDFNTARKYFNEAIKVADRLKDGNIKLYTLNNIGFTYLEQGNFAEAERHFKQSLEVAKTVINKNWHATAYSGLAQVNYNKGLADQAQRQFKIALELRNEIGDKKGISEIYYYLAKMYEASGYLDSAFNNLRVSNRIANQIKAKERILENLDLFKILYVKRKQYDSALFVQTRFIEIRDNLFNENMARNISDIQLRLQEEQAKEQLAEKDFQLKRRTFQSYFLVVITFIILGFALVVSWYYREQKRLGEDLVRKNQEINSQKEEIESQKEALQSSNTELEKAHRIITEQNSELAQLNNKLQSTVDIRTKELELANRELRIANLELDNFIYKSSHDIKGPLVRLLGVCHVALMDVRDEKSREYFEMLHRTAKHINDIFDRLKIVSDINSLDIGNIKINFQRLYKNVHERLSDLDGYSAISFSLNVQDGVEFYSDEFLLETIFHNMMENAVKFQNKSEQTNRFINVNVSTRDNRLIILFSDNGIGIKESDVEHIFQMFSQAALEHQTVGLGLYIVKQCINKLGGTIHLLKSNDKLTEFQVSIPATSVA